MVRAVRALLACVAVAAPASAATPCELLAHLTLPGASVASAVSVPAGSSTPPGGRPVANLPAYCKVTGVINPAADSNIRFEVWMPGSGWNGKFEGVGNGGFAGTINYSDMGSALSHGYATASTDTGHQAGVTDAAWAVGHPEKVADFGYRAIHETAEKAKAVISAFYGQGPRHSYFASCSNGGRQALMEAQRFPTDYDGIIAGAPANFWTHLLAAAAFDINATLADPDSYIPARKLPAIQAAALSACDALDGVKDGLIENPAQCHFEPATLLCHGPESDSCLTAAQVEALTKVYTGPRSSKGEQVFPGYSPGGEAEPGGWAAWITGSAPQQAAMFLFGTHFFQSMVFADPAWDFRTFQVDRDTKLADDKMSRILNATDSDLKRFKERVLSVRLRRSW